VNHLVSSRSLSSVTSLTRASESFASICFGHYWPSTEGITNTMKQTLCVLFGHRSLLLFHSHQAFKYLGIHLDSRLTWKDHVTKKRKQIHLKTKELNWLIGRRSNLSLDNKVLLYKTIIKPIWVYGIEFWGCTSKSNILIIQRSQSKIL
jgi:hypothetical protein